MSWVNQADVQIAKRALDRMKDELISSIVEETGLKADLVSQVLEYLKDKGGDNPTFTHEEEIFPRIPRNLRKSISDICGQLWERIYYPLIKYPRLAESVSTVFGAFTVRAHSQFEATMGESIETSTYGLNAPTYRDAIEKLLGSNTNPRILVAGAETPFSVRQVLCFCDKYESASFILADINQEIIDLSQAYGLNVRGLACDFTDFSSTQNVPIFDIALSDVVLGHILDEVGSEDEKLNQSVRFIGNLASRWAGNYGGMILVDYRCGRNASPLPVHTVFDRISELNEMISSELGLAIQEAGRLKQFRVSPSYEALKERDYRESDVMIQHKGNYMIIGKKTDRIWLLMKPVNVTTLSFRPLRPK